MSSLEECLASHKGNISQEKHTRQPRRRSIIGSEPTPPIVSQQNRNLDDEKYKSGIKLPISKRTEMMTIRIVSTLGCIACFAFATTMMYLSFSNARSLKEHPAAHIHRDLNNKTIDCIVHELGNIAKPNFDDSQIPQRLTCGSDNHGPTVVLLGDYASFFGQRLASGVTSLIIPTNFVSAKLEVDLNDPLALQLISISNSGINNSGYKRGLRQAPAPQRSLIAEYHGYFKTLVVRVSDNSGHSPTYSAAEISKHVFSDNLTMASQYRACSNDQLSFTPAIGGSDIIDGVVDVVVDVNLSATYHSSACVNAADNVLSSNYDIGNTHTYVMYICPDVVDFGIAAGVADINGKKSWYKDTFGSFPYVQMHELGHNLAFFHSGDGIEEYGDATGIMGGYYESELEWGRMCFNAAKTWHTGWYSNQHATVTPTKDMYYGNLVDVNSVFIGYDQNEADVVVKVNDEHEVDLYFMLHRLEGITQDMKDEYRETYANRVNIISHQKGRSSSLVGHLASGEEYIQGNWSNTGQSLHIKVCSITDRYEDGGANVLVFLDGTNVPSCKDVTNDDYDDGVDDGDHYYDFPPSSITPMLPENCQDSVLKIKVNGNSRNCAWVGANKTQQRCEKPGVASHCPLTCTKPLYCNVDSNKRFQTKDLPGFQSCDWVGRKETKQRCQIEGVASTCRETCSPFE